MVKKLNIAIVVKPSRLRIEMKKLDKSRKRGPRFVFTREHKRMRGSIEKVMEWLKTFYC